MFYPKSKQITIGGECVDKNIIFESKTGHTLEGKVDPATEGVLIKVINTKTKQEILSTKTDAKGTYKVGPLYDD